MKHLILSACSYEGYNPCAGPSFIPGIIAIILITIIIYIVYTSIDKIRKN